jgi:hypothetical protein
MTSLPRRYLGLATLILAACGTATDATGVPQGTPSQDGQSQSADAPVGTWVTTITADNLRAAGLGAPAAVAENAGTFTMTIGADGSWTTVQTTSEPVRWPVFRGTYVVSGPRTIDMRTDFPADYAGDVVTVSWSQAADGLHLTLIAPQDPMLKLNLEAHPWAASP